MDLPNFSADVYAIIISNLSPKDLQSLLLTCHHVRDYIQSKVFPKLCHMLESTRKQLIEDLECNLNIINQAEEIKYKEIERELEQFIEKDNNNNEIDNYFEELEELDSESDNEIDIIRKEEKNKVEQMKHDVVLLGEKYSFTSLIMRKLLAKLKSFEVVIYDDNIKTTPQQNNAGFYMSSNKPINEYNNTCEECMQKCKGVPVFIGAVKLIEDHTYVYCYHCICKKIKFIF